MTEKVEMSSWKQELAPVLWQDSTWPTVTNKEIAKVRNPACSFPVCRPWQRRAGECAKTTESYFKHWGLQIRSMAALLLVLKILTPCPHAHASVYSLVPGLPLMLCLRFCFFFFSNAYRLKLNSFIWWFLEYSYQCCFFCELKLYNAPECTPTVWNNVLKEFFK